MKKMLKGAGITLIICAVLLFVIAVVVQEETRPMRVTTGVMIDGEYREIESGYMGGNSKAQEDMAWLKGISVMVGLAGAAGVVGSHLVKEEKEPRY